MLDGGPGSHTLAGLLAGAQPPPLSFDRDIIFFDQRGVGFSTPSLDCAELDVTARNHWLDAPSPAEALAAAAAAARACRDRLTAAGVDISAFTTQESAYDVADLRRALGYQQVDLLGVSYGTALALRVLTLPNAESWVRSVILDSAVPPSADLTIEWAGNFAGALTAVAAACTADTACGTRYGDIAASVYAATAALDAAPVEVQTVDPVTRQPVRVTVDGARLLSIVFGTLYQRGEIPHLPALVDRAARGFGDSLARSVQRGLEMPLTLSEGMNLSVQCTDQPPVQPPSAHAERHVNAGERAGLAPPLVQYAADGARLDAALCAAWNVPPNPHAANPVTSPVPVLILAGEYDPITPPAWGERVARNLPNATLVTLTGTAHGVLFGTGRATTCAQSVALAFLTDPSRPLPLACVARVQRLGFVIR